MKSARNIVIVLLEMHAVYEVARENLAHLPRESSDLGSVSANFRILLLVETTFISPQVYLFS